MIAPQLTLSVKEEIAAARVRAQMRRTIAQAQQAADEAARKADTRRELVKKLATVLPSWMLEYIEDEPDIDPETGTEFILVVLPGCAPLQIRWDMRRKCVTGYDAFEPLRLEWNEEWWVRRTLNYCGDSLDLAIDVAAASGESWHEMAAEASRRNELGITLPYRDDQPEPTLAQILAAIRDSLTRISNVLEASNA